MESLKSKENLWSYNLFTLKCHLGNINGKFVVPFVEFVFILWAIAIAAIMRKSLYIRVSSSGCGMGKHSETKMLAPTGVCFYFTQHNVALIYIKDELEITWLTVPLLPCSSERWPSLWELSAHPVPFSLGQLKRPWIWAHSGWSQIFWRGNGIC